MAEPIQKITRAVVSEEAAETIALEQLISTVAHNREGLEDTIGLLQELHESGVLEALGAMLAAKEKITKILVDQAMRPEATALINNLMSALGGLTKLDPELTGNLVAGLTQGMTAGKESVDNSKNFGIFDLVKAIKDPDVNRTLKFAIGFLGGFGKSL